MQSADDTVPLHILDSLLHYDWSSSDSLTEFMGQDAPLHASLSFSDIQYEAIIETYFLISHLEYKAPDTVPTAEILMNKGTKRLEDNSLKYLQYLLSAAFCPLNLFSYEF